MNSFQERYISLIMIEQSPFLERFSQIERIELIKATNAHLRRTPANVFRVFYLGSLFFTLFPFMRRIIFFKKVEKLIRKLVNTILLLYVSEKLST